VAGTAGAVKNLLADAERGVVLRDRAGGGHVQVVGVHAAGDPEALEVARQGRDVLPGLAVLAGESGG
jgi:hypothetical protein